MQLSLPPLVLSALEALRGHRLILVSVATFLFALTVTFGITGHFYAQPDADAVALADPVARMSMEGPRTVPPIAAATAAVDPSFAASPPEVAVAPAPKAPASKKHAKQKAAKAPTKR